MSHDFEAFLEGVEAIRKHGWGHLQNCFQCLWEEMAGVITNVVDDGVTNLTVEVGVAEHPFWLKSAAGTRRYQPRACMNGETFCLVAAYKLINHEF